MRSLFLFFLSILPLSMLQAQVIDTSELNKLQSGQYKLAEGQLQVLFKDTTTLSFAQKELHSLGLEIKTTEFMNLAMIIENHPKEEDIRSLQNNDAVKMVINEFSYLKSEAGNTTPITEYTLQDIDANMVSDFKFMDQYKVVLVGLNEQASINDANLIMTQFPNLKFNIFNEGRRSAVVLTKPENEEEIITLLESKPFVESVAYMGVLE
jgi:hypothetical protein